MVVEELPHHHFSAARSPKQSPASLRQLVFGKRKQKKTEMENGKKRNVCVQTQNYFLGNLQQTSYTPLSPSSLLQVSYK